MLPMGQLTSLPSSLAKNPFHRLIVKFSRSKTGSFEALFTIEPFLLRYSWLSLFLLFALVLPPLEEIDFLSSFIRALTLVYPAFFIWSLTRISGVELMQLILEGHWTAEILASPINDRDLTEGFISPLWIVIRQYLLISVFSLVLNNLETQVVVVEANRIYMEDLIRSTLLSLALFSNVVAWIVFIYLGRLLAEVRLRNGLLKGLASLALLSGGGVLLAAYLVLIFRYPTHLTSTPMLAAMAALTVVLLVASWRFYSLLARNFRKYLFNQLDIDPLIYDASDPHVSAWEVITEGAAGGQGFHSDS